MDGQGSTGVCMCVVEEVYSELSLEPLGAASLAQVHRAKLRRDGSDVAVKIQHPDVRKNGYTDMATIDVSCYNTYFGATPPPTVATPPCLVPGGVCALGVPLLPFPVAG